MPVFQHAPEPWGTWQLEPILAGLVPLYGDESTTHAQRTNDIWIDTFPRCHQGDDLFFSRLR
jgi:hypothetical protein